MKKINERIYLKYAHGCEFLRVINHDGLSINIRKLKGGINKNKW